MDGRTNGRTNGREDSPCFLQDIVLFESGALLTCKANNNKAGYTAADASGSSILLIPAARLCA